MASRSVASRSVATPSVATPSVATPSDRAPRLAVLAVAALVLYVGLNVRFYWDGFFRYWGAPLTASLNALYLEIAPDRVSIVPWSRFPIFVSTCAALGWCGSAWWAGRGDGPHRQLPGLLVAAWLSLLVAPVTLLGLLRLRTWSVLTLLLLAALIGVEIPCVVAGGLGFALAPLPLVVVGALVAPFLRAGGARLRQPAAT